MASPRSLGLCKQPSGAYSQLCLACQFVMSSAPVSTPTLEALKAMLHPPWTTAESTSWDYTCANQADAMSWRSPWWETVLAIPQPW